MLFSQHGIRAIEEFGNIRVSVSSCGQFQRPIQRLCLTLAVSQLSQSLSGGTKTVETTRHLKFFPTRFFGNPYSGAWTLHQDRQRLSSQLVKKISSSKSLTRLHKQVHAPPLSLTHRRVRARGNFSGHQTSPPALPAADLQSLCPWFSDPTLASPSFVHFSLRRHILLDSF